MDWLNPTYFWAFFAIPLAIGLFLWSAWKRRQALEVFGDRAVVAKLAGPVSTRRRRWKATFLVVALVFMVIALAGPRFGSKLQEVKREGVDLIIALDVSQSMMAQDVLPNRLTKAKFEISKLVSSLTGDRVGLILFAGDAFVQCPLTLDYSALRLFLDISDPSLIPTPGTDYKRMIERTLQMLETTGDEAGETQRTRALMVVSDGENHVEIGELLEVARDVNLVIFAAGVGEKEGVPIPMYANGQQTGFKKDQNGEMIRTKLEEEALLSLARDGGYFRITRTSSSLLEIKDALKRLDRKAFDQQMFEEYEERFQWPLALVLVLLVGERLVSDRRSTEKS